MKRTEIRSDDRSDEIALYRVAELRAIEAAAGATLSPGTLMERAGHAAARLALQLGATREGPILILAGPGDNGGDALVAARVLAARGAQVQVALHGDPARYQGDALTAWRSWLALGRSALHDLDGLDRASLVVDGLFGIGVNRPLQGSALESVRTVNEARQRHGFAVLALDLPSGLTADSGQVAGGAIEASHTLTFLGAKPGLFTGAAADHVGALTIDTLDVHLPASPGRVNAVSLFREVLERRAADSHKGLFGSLGIIAGAPGMRGAALLAARAALYAGSGRVYLNLPERGAFEVDIAQPEIMIRDDLGALALSALVIGPGLGTGALRIPLLEAQLAASYPLVIDADALNLISSSPGLARACRARAGATVLTPHPLEAARLLGVTAAAVQSERVGSALDLAARFEAVVILKGAGSIIAHPDGRYAVNPSGNPGLASGGTGDVLAGVVGALLARSADPWQAALAATWLHGRAADDLVSMGSGPIGLTASELAVALRRQLNRLVNDDPP